MGQLSPEQTIGLLAGALLGLALVATLFRRITGRKDTNTNTHATQPPQPLADQTPASRRQPTPVPTSPPVRLATSPASPQPSYTAVAVAEAARAAPESPKAGPASLRRIDYAGEATTVGPDASYTAIAVAAAARNV